MIEYRVQFTSKIITVKAEDIDDAIAKAREEVCGDPICQLSVSHFSEG